MALEIVGSPTTVSADGEIAAVDITEQIADARGLSLPMVDFGSATSSPVGYLVFDRLTEDGGSVWEEIPGSRYYIDSSLMPSSASKPRPPWPEFGPIGRAKRIRLRMTGLSGGSFIINKVTLQPAGA